MPFKVQWLVEGRVLELKFSGYVSRQDIQSAYQLQSDYVKSEGIVPVHAILDGLEISGLEIKVREVGDFFDRSLSQYFGWTVIVTRNRLLKFMIAVYSKLSGSRFTTVGTYEEAIAIIEKYVPEISPDHENI